MVVKRIKIEKATLALLIGSIIAKVDLDRRKSMRDWAYPYLLPPKDPDYLALPPVELPKHKSKPNKVLTNLKQFAILRNVNKAKRKGDKMATDNKKTSNKSSGLKSAGWLVLAVQQGFVGYVLLSNFSNYFVVAGAIASLLIAGVIVVAHFIGAHKR